MCNSNQQCKMIRKNVASRPIKEHQRQVERCYFCLNNNNPNVDSSIYNKTDSHVRFAYVNRYYEYVNELRR